MWGMGGSTCNSVPLEIRVQCCGVKSFYLYMGSGDPTPVTRLEQVLLPTDSSPAPPVFLCRPVSLCSSPSSFCFSPVWHVKPRDTTCWAYSTTELCPQSSFSALLVSGVAHDLRSNIQWMNIQVWFTQDSTPSWNHTRVPLKLNGYNPKRRTKGVIRYKAVNPNSRREKADEQNCPNWILQFQKICQSALRNLGKRP